MTTTAAACGDFAIALIAVFIVAACWLYAAGGTAARPFAFGRTLSALRAARMMRKAVKEAVQSSREKI